MKTKLIKLQDKFILVSDEEIKEGDKILSPNYEIQTCIGFKTGIGSDLISWIKVKETTTLQQILNSDKIISENPDFSLLSEEDCETIGWVNVEKLVSEHLEKNHIEASENRVKVVSELFKTAQSLNDKMFSLEQLMDAIRFGRELHHKNGEHLTEKEFIQSLQQTSWDVEVEMEEDTTNLCDCYYTKFCKSTQLENGIKCRDEKHFRPKITNNSIKVIKIL